MADCRCHCWPLCFPAAAKNYLFFFCFYNDTFACFVGETLPFRGPVSSRRRTLSGLIEAPLFRMTDWNSTSIYITLKPPLESALQRADKSLRPSQPSAGPRKPLITGLSCPQCRPLIVLSENRCAPLLCSAHRAERSQRLPLPRRPTEASGSDRRPPEFPPPPSPRSLRLPLV